MSASRPRLAIVDMAVAPDSPAGSCVLAEVQGLAASFDVTVFSGRFDAVAHPGVGFVRVPAPERPVLARYLAFHALVPLRYLAWRWRHGRPDCVQATQGQLPRAEICYAHFCHRGYLRHHWPHSTGSAPRRAARWAVHAFNAACEARAMRRARCVVVPSRGLARELAAEYPAVADRLRVLANPVAIDRYRRPPDFDPRPLRARLRIADDALVLCFMALGDFARKGLGLLLEALGGLPAADRDAVRLLVVGGRAGEIAEYEARARALGVGECLRFAGLQADVREFLWAADLFAFPSAYEIFSLAVMQAAAAGLPVLVCEGVYGSEEFVADGVNGWRIERTPAAVAAWLAGVLGQRARLPAMGEAAARSVRPYARETFQARWAALVAAVVRGDDPLPAVDACADPA
jgi:glycosyltransferase involved in cell wall biosynthesis